MQRIPDNYYFSQTLTDLLKRRCDEYPFSEYHMKVALELLKPYAQKVKPAFGTLLGLVRDGRLIPHDTDIDISLYAQDFPFLRGQIQRVFEERGYVCEFRDTNQIVFSHPESVLIDITYFEQTNDGNYICYHQVKDFIISKEAVEDDEKFLEEVYGDWKTPLEKSADYLQGASAEK